MVVKDSNPFFHIFPHCVILLLDLKRTGLVNIDSKAFEYSQIFWVFVFFCYANRKYFRRCFSLYALKCAKYDKYFKFKGIFLRIIWALLASKQFIFRHKIRNRGRREKRRSMHCRIFRLLLLILSCDCVSFFSSTVSLSRNQIIDDNAKILNEKKSCWTLSIAQQSSKSNTNVKCNFLRLVVAAVRMNSLYRLCHLNRSERMYMRLRALATIYAWNIMAYKIWLDSSKEGNEPNRH